MHPDRLLTFVRRLAASGGSGHLTCSSWSRFLKPEKTSRRRPFLVIEREPVFSGEFRSKDGWRNASQTRTSIRGPTAVETIKDTQSGVKINSAKPKPAPKMNSLNWAKLRYPLHYSPGVLPSSLTTPPFCCSMRLSFQPVLVLAHSVLIGSDIASCCDFPPPAFGVVIPEKR